MGLQAPVRRRLANKDLKTVRSSPPARILRVGVIAPSVGSERPRQRESSCRGASAREPSGQSSIASARGISPTGRPVRAQKLPRLAEPSGPLKGRRQRHSHRGRSPLGTDAKPEAKTAW
jgi:hypothetical protein